MTAIRLQAPSAPGGGTGLRHEGSEAGFEAYLLAAEAPLRRLAYLLAGEVALAEDLLQTALLRCWVRWERISAVEDVDAYVRKTLVRTAASHWRRRWSGERPYENLPESVAPLDPPELDRQLLSALKKLPRGQRAVVVLRFAEDLSVEQTATALGCSAGTVKSQTARALLALRGILAERLPSDER